MELFLYLNAEAPLGTLASQFLQALRAGIENPHPQCLLPYRIITPYLSPGRALLPETEADDDVIDVEWFAVEGGQCAAGISLMHAYEHTLKACVIVPSSDFIDEYV